MRRTHLFPFLVVSVSVAAGFWATANAGPIEPQGTQPGDLAAFTPPQPIDSTCATCHYDNDARDEDGKHFRPWDTWGGTMMANSMRDPLYLAAITVAEQDAPGIGTFCLRCHTPQGFVKGNAVPADGSKLDDDDKQGVACEACHRSLDPSVTSPVIDPKGPYVGNARLFWEKGTIKHGPYSDGDSPQHTIKQDPFTSSSKLCGQCHEVYNPLVNQKDASGKDTGRPFPLDTTYTEWANSAFASGAEAKQCQDCHMTRAKGKTLAVSTALLSPERDSPRVHGFVGGNLWGIEAVKAANPTIATARKDAFDFATTATKAMLATAVKLELTGVPAALKAGDALSFKVRVTNNAGHKFPTGYADGRRAFLRIEILDDKGAQLAVIGKYDDATGELVADPQLRVYQAVHVQAGTSGGTPLEWHIAKSDTVAKDTRIPPKGFVPGPTTAILGADYSDGASGIRNYDEPTINFDGKTLAAVPSGKLQVKATVLNQSTERAFVDELVKANTKNDTGKNLKAAYEATGKAAPVEIASATASFDFTGGTAPGDAGGDTSPSGDTGGPGAQPGSDDSGGCGCTVVGAPVSAAGAFASFVTLLLALRRRKGRP